MKTVPEIDAELTAAWKVWWDARDDKSRRAAMAVIDKLLDKRLGLIQKEGEPQTD